MINLSLVRRRIRSNNLKMKFHLVGRNTKTTVCVCYMQNIAKQYVVDEVEKVIGEMDIYGVLDTNYITEYISKGEKSPFPLVGTTERPDTVAGKILEGRVAIFVDGTPMVVTVPYLFIENFQSSEDYYMDPFYATISRILRMISFVLSITIPSIFIAIVAFHPEMLPTPLMINIASERKSLPLPAALEAFLMLIIFDILRETGVRMPSSIGTALSIVGALVIGQAAVAAKLVSAPMIIVVATTGITSLLIPKLNSAVVISRFLLLVLTSFLGFYGLICGLMIIAIHVLSLKSFGIPEFLPDLSAEPTNAEDVVVRAPIYNMFRRPKYLSANHTRVRDMTPEKEQIHESK
jgi:spore germination protein KA